MNKTLVLALSNLLTPLAYADQGGFSNSGGSTQVSSGVVIHSTVATPAGTLTINCPATGPAIALAAACLCFERRNRDPERDL